MNDADLKVRKQWLFWLFGLTLVNIVSFLIDFPARTLSGSILTKSLLLVQAIGCPLVYNYILYKCAYKKPGTKLLSFIIVASPILFVIGIFMFGFLIMKGDMPGPSPLSWIMMILNQVLFFRWYYVCFKMKKINLRLQELKNQ